MIYFVNNITNIYAHNESRSQSNFFEGPLQKYEIRQLYFDPESEQLSWRY